MIIPFDASEDYILENETVLLRPLTKEDHKNLLYFSLNEPEIWKYSLMQPNSAAALTAYLETAEKARAAATEYPFIVFDKRTRQYAGSTRYYDILPAYQTLQLGYTWYGSTFQGTGLNVHCKLLLLEFAFEKLGMERVEFRADNNNKRSIAAMQGIGCTIEGVLRSNMPTVYGHRRDSIVLSILKGEWENGVKENLLKKISAR